MSAARMAPPTGPRKPPTYSGNGRVAKGAMVRSIGPTQQPRLRLGCRIALARAVSTLPPYTVRVGTIDRHASGGAIAAGHPVTAAAGAEVLAAGGNAVDASIAAGAASWSAE